MVKRLWFLVHVNRVILLKKSAVKNKEILTALFYVSLFIVS